MLSADTERTIMDANGWIDGLAYYRHVGVINHRRNSPIANRFIRENFKTLRTPLHVWLEVRNKLFVIDKYAGKNSQRLAKNNPLLAKCEELGRPELSTPLTWKTWHQFLRYTESRVLCRDEYHISTNELRVKRNESWRMYEYIYHNDPETYYGYIRKKEKSMRNKPKREPYTPSDCERNEEWPWWYPPPPNDLDIIAIAGFYTEKSGLRVGVFSSDRDLKMLFDSITKGTFDNSPYRRNPVCRVKFVKDYIGGHN